MIDNSKFVWKTIERDEELINSIIAAETEFWNYNVLQNIPPEIDGSEAATNLLNNLYPKSNAEQISLPSGMDEIIEKLNEAKDWEKTWKETKTSYENQLKEVLRDNEAGVTGKHLITWKNVSSNRVDTKLLKEKYPEIYEAVCKESSYRKFGVK
jgi:predicted phage-related endonuclease